MTLDTSTLPLLVLPSARWLLFKKVAATKGGSTLESRHHLSHCRRSFRLPYTNERSDQSRRATAEPTAENCRNRIQEHSGTQEYAGLTVAEHYVVHLGLTRR